MTIETASAVPRSPVSAAITIRGHDVVQDKPPSLGGTDDGPMASELLLAGMLACQLSTFHKIAAKRRSPARARSIDGALHLDDAGDISRIVITWDIAGAEGKDAETLTRLTERACTVSRALKVPVEWSVM